MVSRRRSGIADSVYRITYSSLKDSFAFEARTLFLSLARVLSNRSGKPKALPPFLGALVVPTELLKLLGAPDHLLTVVVDSVRLAVAVRARAGWVITPWFVFRWIAKSPTFVPTTEKECQDG